MPENRSLPSQHESETILGRALRAVLSVAVLLVFSFFVLPQIAGAQTDGWEVVSPKDLTMEGDSFRMPDSSVEIRAKFRKMPAGGDGAVPRQLENVPDAVTNHTVMFDANGGTNVMGPQVASSETMLVANKFAKQGYVFDGWNGTGRAYADKATYAFDADVTLYAQWKISSVPATGATLPATGDAVVPIAIGVIVVAGIVLAIVMHRRS